MTRNFVRPNQKSKIKNQKFRLPVPTFLTAFLGLALSTSAQTFSTSKLSAHLINSYTAGSSNIVAGHPRTLKVLGVDSGFPSSMAQAMRDYKAKVPTGKVVVRI